MHKTGLWQRWFGLSKQARKPAARCVVRGPEALERREMLSALAAASTLGLLDAPLDPTAILGEGGKTGGKAGGGGGTTATHYTYESMRTQLQDWAAEYPSLVQLERIGEGAQRYNDLAGGDAGHRGLWAIKISDDAGNDDAAEPDLKYIANMHGNEPLGMEMCMRFIEELLTNYTSTTDTSPDTISGFVNNNEIWVLPMMNPDGFANNTRANFNGYNLNRSFPELAPLDPYADVKPDFAGLLASLPADKKGNCLVPEVKAVMEWSNAHDFVLAANFHTGALLVNYPFDNDATTTTAHYAASPDDGLYVDLANLYADNYNVASPLNMEITNGADWFVISGGMQDFDYRYFGTIHVTVELNENYGYGTKRNPIDLNLEWSYHRGAMLAYLQTGVALVVPQPVAPETAAVWPAAVDPAMLQTVACGTDLAGKDQSANKRRASVLLQDDVLRDWAVTEADAIAVSL